MSLGVKQVHEVEGPRGFQLGDFVNEGTWQSVKNGKPKKIRVGMHVDIVGPRQPVKRMTKRKKRKKNVESTK